MRKQTPMEGFFCDNCGTPFDVPINKTHSQVFITIEEEDFRGLYDLCHECAMKLYSVFNKRNPQPQPEQPQPEQPKQENAPQ